MMKLGTKTVLNSSENDSGGDSCSDKGDKSSHVTDEGGSSPEESAHIAAQNIASEASRNAEIDNSHTESDNQSEIVNIDSTDNSSKEMDIDVITKLFVKKKQTKNVWNFRDRLQN